MSKEKSNSGTQPESQDGKSQEEYVAKIMELEAELAAVPAPTVKRRSRLPILFALLPILTGLLAWNIARFVYSPAVFTDAEIEADAMFTLFVTAQGLEAYWDSAGTLPPSLEAVQLDDEYLRYELVNDSIYILTVTDEATELVYRRGEDIARFNAAADVLEGETGQ